MKEAEVGGKARSWRCLIKLGYQGTGRYLEKVVLVEAPNIIQTIQKAWYYPGTKNHLRDCVLQVKPAGQIEAAQV